VADRTGQKTSDNELALLTAEGATDRWAARPLQQSGYSRFYAAAPTRERYLPAPYLRGRPGCVPGSGSGDL
jgi:hypothetical protein